MAQRVAGLFRVKYIILGLLILFMGPAGGLSMGRSKKDITLRVKILDIKSAVMITGKGMKIEPAKGKSRRLKADSVTVEPFEGKIRIGGEDHVPPVRISSSGKLSVRGREYRGDFLVIQDEGLVLVNEVPLEQYLYGVINNEISSTWPKEALKAQAVLARTYALLRKEQRKDHAYHLDCTTRDQVYTGVASEDEAVRNAVDQTRGMILVYHGKPAEAFYHSSCGGRTETPHYVWGGQDKKYHQSVNCTFCEEAPHYFWRYPEDGQVSGKELARLLGQKGVINSVRILERSPSGRVLKVRFRTKGPGNSKGEELIISGRDLRKRIGQERIRSTAFEIKLVDRGIVFFGSGAGHGVGMCQWGAKGMAEKGYHYQEILMHYFPGTKISKIR
jgi:stage II sporulation protein D